LFQQATWASEIVKRVQYFIELLLELLDLIQATASEGRAGAKP
jgi:hypothetical protein